MKTPIVRYLKFVKNIVTFLCVALGIAIFISLGFAFSGYIGFMIIAPALMVVFLVIYGIYAVKFSLDLVLAVECGSKTLVITTKRKSFTFGLDACTDVKETDRKYVCTFRTETSEDKFTFLKRAPFMKPYETCFTEEDIRTFYPDFEGE